MRLVTHDNQQKNGDGSNSVDDVDLARFVYVLKVHPDHFSRGKN